MSTISYHTTSILLLGLTVGCQSAPTSDKPNVLLLTWDTVRADRVIDRPKIAPFYSEMAQSGTEYLQARTVAPLTLPAHGSLLTGLDPHEHGLRHNIGFQLDEKHTTIAEQFSANGWTTGGFVSVTVLDSTTGIQQGFSHYDDRLPALGNGSHFPERHGQQTIAAAIEWVKNTPVEEPIFLWVHLYDPHRPWTPSYQQAQNHEDLYDAEIAATDAYTKELFVTVQNHAQKRNTILAITSDHGESNGEHGESTHGWFAYESSMRIPLLLWDSANQTGKRSNESVDLIDLHNGLERIVNGEKFTVTPRAATTTFESETPLFELGAAPIQGVKEGNLIALQSPIPEVYDISTDLVSAW